MKKQKYYKGETISNHLNMMGRIFNVKWNEVGDTWLYFVSLDKGGEAVIKESNIKHKK